MRHERPPAQQLRERARYVREGRRPQDVGGADPVDVQPAEVPAGIQQGLPGVLDVAVRRDQHHPHPHLHDPVVPAGEQPRGLQVDDGVPCHGTLTLRLRLSEYRCGSHRLGEYRQSPAQMAKVRAPGRAAPGTPDGTEDRRGTGRAQAHPDLPTSGRSAEVTSMLRVLRWRRVGRCSMMGDSVPGTPYCLSCHLPRHSRPVWR